MKDLIIVIILVLIAASAAFYIYREKKKGAKCIGCPYAKQCSGKCSEKKK